MSCIAHHYFVRKANLIQKLYKSTTTGVVLGQEKLTQNAAVAKTHFYMFKNITDGCQIIFIRTKCLSRSLMETEGCLDVVQKKQKKQHICNFSLSIYIALRHNENAVCSDGWARPLKRHCQLQKIDWNQKTNLFFWNLEKSLWGLCGLPPFF